MRSLAIIAAGSCAVGSACVFLYKRSKDRKRRVERLEPRSSDCGPELGSTALPESTEFNPEVERLQPHSSDCGAELGWTVLPESTEFLDKLPEKSPLRAFFAHAVTRRILNAMPVYLVLIPISVYAPRAGPAGGAISYMIGVLFSVGTLALLWPTDKGVQSASWYRFMVPQSFVRAVLVTRAVWLDYVGLPACVSLANMVMNHANYLANVAVFWTLFVLNARGKNRWRRMRILWSLRAGAMAFHVLVLRFTTLEPHQRSFPPRMNGAGYPFHAAIAQPTFTLLFVASLTPANRQALANFALRGGLTRVPIHLSQIPTIAARLPKLLADPRDVWGIMRNILSPPPSSASDPGDASSARSETDSTSRHHTAKLGPQDGPCILEPVCAVPPTHPGAD